MQKPRAQIINFENNRNINKSIVFVSLLIHYFATSICGKLWYVMGKQGQIQGSFLVSRPPSKSHKLNSLTLIGLLISHPASNNPNL